MKWHNGVLGAEYGVNTSGFGVTAHTPRSRGGEGSATEAWCPRLENVSGFNVKASMSFSSMYLVSRPASICAVCRHC